MYPEHRSIDIEMLRAWQAREKLRLQLFRARVGSLEKQAKRFQRLLRSRLWYDEEPTDLD